MKKSYLLKLNIFFIFTINRQIIRIEFDLVFIFLSISNFFNCLTEIKRLKYSFGFKQRNDATVKICIFFLYTEILQILEVDFTKY